VGRSSFAIAMKDYTFIRPGIAVSISAATLALALVIGFWLIVSLRGAAATVANGARTVETLHRYNAGLEVWREMVTSTDPAYRRPEAVAQRDSIGRALREQLARLGNEMADPADHERVQQVLEGLTRTDPSISTAARQAMIVLLAKQDSAMFKAAETSQKAVLLSAALLGLTVVAAGMLVIPMAWLYIRYKRGATIEVKV
jgi:prophage DNA circulation protein